MNHNTKNLTKQKSITYFINQWLREYNQSNKTMPELVELYNQQYHDENWKNVNKITEFVTPKKMCEWIGGFLTPQPFAQPQVQFEYMSVFKTDEFSGYHYRAEALDKNIYPDVNSSIDAEITVPTEYDIVQVLNHYGSDGWEYIGREYNLWLFKRRV